jgi:hypothetical protein
MEIVCSYGLETEVFSLGTDGFGSVGAEGDFLRRYVFEVLEAL